MSLLEEIKARYFTRHAPMMPGIYHYQAPPDSAIPHRYHLRVERDGLGILILNASTVLHLNQTACEYAYYLVQNTPIDEVTRNMVRRYRIDRNQAFQDFQDFKERLQTMIETPDLDPVAFFGFERLDPYSSEINTPYRLDCALTYQVMDGRSGHMAPVERVKRELISQEWKTIIEKAWQAGIPHLVFTGGEPTLRPDLSDLIAYAEKCGQVTGLLTKGLRLAEPEYLQGLLQSGLDYVMIVLEPAEEQSWEALRDTLAEDIHVTVHVTIIGPEEDEYIKIIDRLQKTGVRSISLSMKHPDLKQVLSRLQHEISYREINLVWDLPVPYSSLNPVALELQESQQTVAQGAGRAWLYVEPDGDVLRAQGLPKVLGNFLTDSWEQIWQKTGNSTEE